MEGWKTKVSRRDVFPKLDQNMKSIRSCEKLFQSSRRDRLSNPEQCREDLRTFLHDRCFDGEREQAYEVPSTTGR